MSLSLDRINISHKGEDDIQSIDNNFQAIENEINSHLADYATLKANFAKRIEYLLLDARQPGDPAHRFDVPPRTNKFFVLNQKQDGFTTVISVSSYSTDGIVWTVLNDGAAIAITTNADRTAIFFRPEHSTRGFVITTTGV